jgi:hypothetical protein
MESIWARWSQLSVQQRELPPLVDWKAALGEGPRDPLLSASQAEMARLRHGQQSLAEEIASLRASVEKQLGGLPDLLESLANRQAAQVVSPSVAVAEQRPAPAAAPEQGVPALPAADALMETVEEPVSLEPAIPIARAATQTEPALAPPLEIELPLPVEPTVAELPTGELSTQAIEPLPVALPPVEPEVTAVDQPVSLVEPSLDSVEESPSDLSPEAGLDAEPLSPPADRVTEPAGEGSGESLSLTRDELLELLQAEPRDESGHRAVKTMMPDPKDRINFFRDLVRIDKDQIYHSLALARAYRDADQTKVAVVHYQKYLRSEKDAQAQLELADAYDELGKSNLSVAARKAAEQMMS